MTIRYIPAYIRSVENQKSGDVVTADRWNAVHNLLVTQGDANSATIDEIVKLLNAGSLAGNPLDIPPDVPSVYDDEFDGEALDAKWNWIYSEAGELTPPTPLWTQEQLDEYRADQAMYAFEAVGNALVEQYGKQYGYAALTAYPLGTVSGDGALDVATILVSDIPILFVYQGDGFYPRTVETYTNERMLAYLIRNNDTGVIEVTPPSAVTADNFSSLNSIGNVAGKRRLISYYGFLQFQTEAGIITVGEENTKLYGFIGPAGQSQRVMSLRNSRLILDGSYKGSYWYDRTVTFLTQPLVSPTFPLAVSAKLDQRIIANITRDTIFGLVLRNRVTTEYAAYVIGSDYYGGCNPQLRPGSGASNDKAVWDALLEKQHVQFFDVPDIQGSNRLRFVLTDTGIDVYDVEFDAWVKIDTYLYTELFTNFQESDKANFDIGLAFIQDLAGPHTDPYTQIESVAVDWFRVEAV